MGISSSTTPGAVAGLDVGAQSPPRPSKALDGLQIRKAEACERAELLAWLDRGLRDGRSGRLLAEYPTALSGPGLEGHFLISSGRRFAAHAYARVIEVVAAGHSAPLGMISLVYTDPAFRGRGFASACVNACAQHLSAVGVPLAALWSDRHSLYQRLGFEPAGRELLFTVTPEICRRLRNRLGGGPRTGSPREGDWPALEALYATKPSRALRPAGDLIRLAAAPDCRVSVARSGGRIVAYAALGRGDDLGGVVHEWAGEPSGVAACLEALLDGHQTIACLSGPCTEPPMAALREAGSVPHSGVFALIRLLDPSRLWRCVSAGSPALASTRLSYDDATERCVLSTGEGEIRLSRGEALQLALGPNAPEPARSWLAQLGPGRAAIPWPLFIWGFDSI